MVNVNNQSLDPGGQDVSLPNQSTSLGLLGSQVSDRYDLSYLQQSVDNKQNLTRLKANVEKDEPIMNGERALELALFVTMLALSDDESEYEDDADEGEDEEVEDDSDTFPEADLETSNPETLPPVPKDKADFKALLKHNEGVMWQQSWELFEPLGEERGWKAAFYSYMVHKNLNQYLVAGDQKAGKKYHSEVKYQDYDGKTHALKFSCVGSTMSGLAGLPIKAMTGDNVGRYASDYYWGPSKNRTRGLDGYGHFIPDLVGGDSSRYYNYKRMDPEKINEEVGSKLVVGEHCLAAFWNHIFTIYKDVDGVVKMIHSGRNVDENGKPRGGVSRINETTLEGYAKYNKDRYKHTQFIFLPLSNIVYEAEEHGNVELSSFYKQQVDQART